MKVTICDFCKDPKRVAKQIVLPDGTFKDIVDSKTRLNFKTQDICLECLIRKVEKHFENEATAEILDENPNSSLARYYK